MTRNFKHDQPLDIDYVDVEDEPNHSERVKNEYVHAYLATIPPGTCTLYHRHGVNTLYIVVEPGLSRSEAPGNQKQRIGVGRSTHAATKLSWWFERKRGRQPWFPTGTLLMYHNGEFPLIHRLCADARNQQPIRMLGMALLTNARPLGERAPKLKGLPLEYQDDQVTAYRIKLAPEKRTSSLHPAQPSILAVVSGNAELQGEARGKSADTLTAGTVKWFDQDDIFELANPGATPLHAFLITIRTAPSAATGAEIGATPPGR
jgi:hypothetical protein